MNQELVAEILALPASERVRLVDAIWDSIAEAPDALELTQWQRDELDSRLAEFEADPDSGATLEEVFARIRRASRLDGLLLGPEPSATSGLRQPSTPNSQTLKHEPGPLNRDYSYLSATIASTQRATSFFTFPRATSAFGSNYRWRASAQTLTGRQRRSAGSKPSYQPDSRDEFPAFCRRSPQPRSSIHTLALVS